MPDNDKAQSLLDLEIIIGEDGEVIFPDLNGDLLDVALALDPDSDLSCRRPASAELQKQVGAEEPRTEGRE